MHSYVESVSLAVPMYSGEERAVLGARRPNRLQLVGGTLAILACSALILSAFTTTSDDDTTSLTEKLTPKIKPKFVDWKKEDAGSDDMNLHLKVADALARADGLAEKNLSPVPENLLKEAQQAAEEQRSMPGLAGDDGSSQKSSKKPEIPASLEKMFQQAEAEQKVEKLAKEGDHKRDAETKSKKAAVKAAAAKKVASSTSKAEKSASMKLLNQVSQDAATSTKKLAKVIKGATK